MLQGNFYIYRPRHAPICLILITRIWYFTCHYPALEDRATIFSMENHQGSGRFRFGCVVLFLCLGIGISQGCGGPDTPNPGPIGATPPPAEQNLPFHPSPDHATDDSAHPAVPADGKMGPLTPFRAGSHSATRSLPAGTLITVRLESSLPISQVHPGDAFSASLAGPVMVGGETAVERGTPVSGQVEAAQLAVDRPGLSPDPGFVRLTLKTMTIDGSALALQTSSLFAKGTFATTVNAAADASDRSGFCVKKGRRLTFRLTAPVSLATPNSVANRQYSGPPSE
jgi:hypothetical protein